MEPVQRKLYQSGGTYYGVLDNLTEIATDLAQSGAAASKHLAETSIATSKRLAEIAKLKTSNLAEEGSIKKAYAELGRLYYAEHGNTPEGAYAAACERITVSRELIQANNDRIAELKSAAEAEGEVIVDADFQDVPEEAAPAEEAAPVEEAASAEETVPAEETKPEA